MKKFGYYAYLFMIFLFLYLPIVILIIFSFNSSKNQYYWEGFTFDWYLNIPSNSALMSALFTTIIIAIISTLLSTTLGFFASLGIFYSRKKIKSKVLFINNIPLINPDIVTGISLMLLFLIFGISFGKVSMLLAHIMFSVPFVILALLPRLGQLDKDLVDAAKDLGLSDLAIVRKIILPLCKPGLIAGALFAFTMSIDDFVISYFTTGNGVQNLSMWIYTQTKRGISPLANAVSAIMFIVILVLLCVYYIFEYKGEKKS